MLRVAVIAALALISSTALAAEYRTREVGGWEIAESDDGQSCYIGMEYEGEGSTLVVLSVDLEKRPMLLVSNYNWSIKDDDKFKLNYELSSGVYEDHPALGSKSGISGGFVTSFEQNFPQYFAESTYLNIVREGSVVDELSLSGTGVAVGELRKCLSIIKARADAEAREKARFSHIPKDPFAPTGPDPDQ